jgi:POT family proton-dependent oligopeptide transporter
MMGVWFISISLGNLLAGLVAGKAATLSMAEVFLGVFLVTVAAGLLLIALSRRVKKMMGGT